MYRFQPMNPPILKSLDLLRNANVPNGRFGETVSANFPQMGIRRKSQRPNPRVAETVRAKDLNGWYVKLIFCPKPTSTDAAESSGFVLRAYRASSLQYCGYSPRCSGVAQVGRLVRITFTQRTILFFYEFVKMEYSRSLTSEVLGQAFGIEPSHVRKIRSKAATSLSARTQ
jgi:hypothetical protein